MSLFKSPKHVFWAPVKPAPKRCIFQTFLKTFSSISLSLSLSLYVYIYIRRVRVCMNSISARCGSLRTESLKRLLSFSSPRGWCHKMHNINTSWKHMPQEVLETELSPMNKCSPLLQLSDPKRSNHCFLVCFCPQPILWNVPLNDTYRRECS